MVTPNTTSLTRCPVCRKGVSDLSHHFAMEHEDSTARPVTKIARSTVTRIIPIVLPNHPGEYFRTVTKSRQHLCVYIFVSKLKLHSF